ncbi:MULTISPECIES: hypothetical protein [Calditerrivibrio]|uniref:Flagellar protein n=1 Tax=Calditerrivibrio nitroreducens TaxID=477976 RepID=A0A2J6WIU6_9BACT|nr:MAG: hypothetical protein C0187_05650 [Calditerrivibrio nitroreducens]
MSRFFVILFLLLAICSYAGNVTIDGDNKNISVGFNLGVKTEIIEKRYDNNALQVAIKGEYDINADQIWNQHINKIIYSKNNGITNIRIVLEDKPEKYDVASTDNGFVAYFNFKEKVSEPPTGGGTFAKMIFSILIILAIILIFYWLIKMFMKKTYMSDIPGIGRSLGKIDLMPGRSIIFYEIKNIVYMFGLSGDSIALLDKIEDENVIDAIKTGFSKKQDFSSYFRFFGDKAIKEEIEVSSTIIKDKVESLKKRN